MSDDEIDRETILRRRKRAVGLLLILVAVCVAVIGSEVRKSLNLSECRSNLSALGQAMLLYANGEQGHLPPDWGTLAYSYGITPPVFICPDSGTKDPGSVPAEQLVEWVNDHSDYVYLGAGVVCVHDPVIGYMTNPKRVLAYDKESNHPGQGMHVLFGDGHVEWMNIEAARRAIAQSAAIPATTVANSTTSPSP